MMKTKAILIRSLIGTVVLICFSLAVNEYREFGIPPDPRETPTLAPSPSDRFSAVDRILEQLEFGNIVFNAPKTMNLHDTAVIHLVLGLKAPLDDLKRMIEAAGEKEGARIRVANRMEARLSGPDFSITAITPEMQAVSHNDITEWKWEVKPSDKGNHNLHLTLSAILSVEDESTPRAIRTFDKIITVEVSWLQRIDSFWKKNWQWIWAALLIPALGWLWKSKRKLNFKRLVKKIAGVEEKSVSEEDKNRPRISNF